LTFKLSILDLAPITEGNSASEALNNSLELAQLAESIGFHRYWLAEHHNMIGIASSATSVVIGFIANGTSKIRLGSGGIMLPNHSPLIIAEQFGTLATLYPNRIDLGVGRAPGTDQLTSNALRRSFKDKTDYFPEEVVELQNYLKTAKPNQKVVAIPGEGTNIPLYILGSSLYGASLAAALGLPLAFASHFAPHYLIQAIEIYRNNFSPSEQLKKPYIILGFNIFGADTIEEAEYLRSSSLQSYLNLRKGKPGKLPPPIRDFQKKMSSEDKQLISSMVSCYSAGNTEIIKNGINDFINSTGADELILVSSIYDHSKRMKSYKIASEVFC
tara:strand:- start:28817 stop:29803 length:987 start_codon:yes stop_codon:yes gene_type:complete